MSSRHQATDGTTRFRHRENDVFTGRDRGAGPEIRGWTRPRRWSCVLAAIFLVLTLTILPVSAEGPRAKEYELKAVFLNKLVAFVSWPETHAVAREQGLVIGVLGEDPFNGVLERVVEGRIAQGESVKVLHSLDPEDLRDCHLVFIARSEKPQLCAHLEALGKYPVLTVSDIEEFSSRGGILTLIMRNRKVRLQVNPSAYKGAGLTISAKLLAFSEEVQEHDCW